MRFSGVSGRGFDWWMPDPLPGADFTVEAFDPNKPRLLQFVHEGKKLSGFLRLQGDEKGPLQVRLERWGTLTGRLIALEGKPVTRLRTACYPTEKYQGEFMYDPFQRVQPDANGRFRIDGLAPGLKYDLWVFDGNNHLEIVGGRPKELTFQAGEMKDLGEVQFKPRE